MRTTRSWVKAIASIAGLALGIVVIVYVFRSSDILRILQILHGAGYWTGLVLVPFVLIVSVDSVAWQVLFRSIGRYPPWSALALTRAASEALVLTLPAGVAAAETMKPLLLYRVASLDYASGIAGVFLKKCFVALSQGTYVLLAIGVGALFLMKCQTSFRFGDSIIPLLAIIGLGFICLGLLGLMLCFSPRESRVLNWIVALIPVAAWSDQVKDVLTQIRSAFKSLYHIDVTPLLRVALLLTSAWLLESLESFITLKVLSVSVPIGQILPMEVSVSLLRSFVFFVPAAVGVQEMGYASFLMVAGVPDPLNVAAAFALIKRAKEVVIITIGYIMLAAILGRRVKLKSRELTTEAT